MSMPPVEIPARDSLSRWRQRLMLALLTAGGVYCLHRQPARADHR